MLFRYLFANHLLVNTHDEPTFKPLLPEFDLHVGCRVDALLRWVDFVFEQLVWSGPLADLDLHVNQITRLELVNEFLCDPARVSQLAPFGLAVVLSCPCSFAIAPATRIFTLRLSGINKTRQMQSTFWWVWLLSANCVWILQRLISELSDKTVPENELTLFWGAVRIVLITVMILCFALSLILFVVWVRADSHRLALQRPHALAL